LALQKQVEAKEKRPLQQPAKEFLEKAFQPLKLVFF
jgi:hypothetical protein